MDTHDFSEMNAAMDEQLNEFAQDDSKRNAALAGAAGVGVVGAGYAGLRRKDPSRRHVLNGELKVKEGARAVGQRARVMGRGASRAAAPMLVAASGSKAAGAGAAGGDAVKRGMKVLGKRARAAKVLAKMNFDEVDSEFEGNDRLLRVGVGTTAATAIRAPRGRKLRATGSAYKHEVKEGMKGLGIGAALGGTAAAAAGALSLRKGRGLKRAAKLLKNGRVRRAVGYGTVAGAGIGAYAGGVAGAVNGGHGEEANRKYRAATARG